MPSKKKCYMIESQEANRTFIGSTSDSIAERLAYHNGERPNGESSLMDKRDWNLSFVISGFKKDCSAESFESKLRRKIRRKHFHDTEEEKTFIAYDLSQKFSNLVFQDWSDVRIGD